MIYRSMICGIVIALAASFATVQAQTRLPAIEPKTAEANRTVYVAPMYPPIAKAAHVSGTVVFQIEIEADGRVGTVKTFDGPPMLVAAAKAAVRQWHYQPYRLNGKPEAATTFVSIPFELPAEPAGDFDTQKEFFPLSNRCHEAMYKVPPTASAADVCRQAAVVADKFAANSRYIERRSAYTYASTALMRDSLFEEALIYAEKAVAVAELGHDDGSGRAAVYGVRGQAKAGVGDMAGSDKDLTRAEDEQRAALETSAGHELHAEYTQTLKGLLLFHARVLQAMNQSQRAQAKLDEAAKLT